MAITLHVDSVLDRRKETRKRGISFHAPVMVPLSPHIRIVQDDPAYVSLVRDCGACGAVRKAAIVVLTDDACAPRMLGRCRRSSTKTTARAMGSLPTPPWSCSWTACAASSISARRRPVTGYAPLPLGMRVLFFLFRMLTPSRVGQASSPQKLEQLTHRMDVFDDITTRLVPTDMLSQVRLATKERHG